MKKISILILSVILMMGVSGCMNNSENTSKKTIGEKALIYMENKYNEKFNYIGSTDGGFDADNRTLLISPQNNSDIQIDVSYHNNKGYEEYAENYPFKILFTKPKEKYFLLMV